jgi:hypothetical protein
VSTRRSERQTAAAARSAGPDAGQNFLLVEAHERVLIRPDLMDVDVVEARRLELGDRVDVLLGIGPADDRLRDVSRGPPLGEEHLV